MNEIVNIHNDLIDLNLRGFGASEIDILAAICHEVQNEGANEITIPLSKLRKLSQYRNKNEEQFLAAILRTNRKLLHLDFTIRHSETHFTQFVLFPIFETNLESETLKVQVNAPFLYILNELSGNYTSLELQQSAALKSSYSKNIYKHLRKWKNSPKPKWVVTIEEFREMLDIPKSYRMTNIDGVVLKPAMAELAPYFKGLRVEKLYEKGQRGRPRVKSLAFTYQAMRRQEKSKDLSADKIAKMTGWKKTRRVCPECGEAVYEKQLQNENGTYFIYGHPDFKTGGCDYTSTHIDDFKEASRVQIEKENKERAKEFTDEQRSDNLSKLAEMMGKLFK